jgi:hypothetical protein
MLVASSRLFTIGFVASQIHRKEAAILPKRIVQQKTVVSQLCLRFVTMEHSALLSTVSVVSKTHANYFQTDQFSYQSGFKMSKESVRPSPAFAMSRSFLG